MPWVEPSIYLSLLTNYKEILWEDFGHLIIQGKFILANGFVGKHFWEIALNQEEPWLILNIE